MSTPSLLKMLSANQLIAHRGFQQYFPENSPLAIQKAIEYGAHYIEIDVQFSNDGIPLLYHDDDLQRTSGIAGKLSQYTFAELSAFSANEPSRLCNQFHEVKISPLQTLVEIMQQHRHIEVLVELKEEATRDYGAAFCLQRIHDVLQPVLSRCILISFDIDALRVAKKFGFTRLGAVLRDWSSRHNIANELEAEMIICNHRRIPDRDSLHMENCRVALYEVDDLALAHALLARGADLIETFSIGKLLGTHD
ncbi:MAG: glycerophosphodiester phosphodiesterase family protein [Pseudomonadales bacterium]